MKFLALILAAFWLLAMPLGHVSHLNPDTIALDMILQSPSAAHWLGTDDLGRDILARVLHGVEVSLSVALIVTALTLCVGVMLGLMAAYVGGTLDAIIWNITNIFQAFPGMLLAIAFAAVLGPGLSNLLFALCLTGWVSYARLTRGQALLLRQRAHVLAAEALGANAWRIMFKHMLPLLFSVLLVEATYSLASVMIAEASLSFLGLGLQPPQASWGAMLRDGVRFMLVAPHYVLTVGFCMMSLILAINLGGDWLRDKLDVRSEG